jgi:hypothetical protein
VTDYGKWMMRDPECVIGSVEQALVGVFKFEQLGVVGWPETEFFGPRGWEHINQFGLVKCLPDDGPYVRIAHAKQELGEGFPVAHDPISFGGYSSVWDVAHNDNLRRYLDGWCLDASILLNAGRLVALRLA